MIDDDEPKEDFPNSDYDHQDSGPWLAAIQRAVKAHETYNEKCDRIEKLYADLDRLGASSRDREMQMFWANIGVIGPSIYARPPVPVVVPRFRDRKPVPRMASELLERATSVTFALEDMDSVMRLVRDDLIVTARGVIWLRYDEEDEERVCIELLDRKDFLHDDARTWKDVGWVARRGWMTLAEMRKRFGSRSGSVYETAKLAEIAGGDETAERKAGVWEIWSKTRNEVVWVVEGCEKVLDHDKPHLTLEDFFPCPRPAYGTLQRRSLVPVPDMLFYKDQLEEINELTGRISGLTEAIRLRGFFPAGVPEVGEALEAALKTLDDNAILVPVKNLGAVTAGSKLIEWLPLNEIAQTITGLVALRKQLIDDVYQITGLSDIMRGSTVASETLGAQQLKSQYGSIRIRDRQDELIRIARDTARIAAEIMAENFDRQTLLDMTRMEIDTDADIRKEADPIKKEIADFEAKLKQALASPELKQQAEANPQIAEQLQAQATQHLQELSDKVRKIEDKATIEQVMDLLREERTRPFVLDIQTDSTITPDENAQKQRATEFIQAVGGFLSQSLPLVQALPQAAPMAAEFLKFLASQFRAGREMEGRIEEFAETMQVLAGQPKPDPQQAQREHDTQQAQAKLQLEAQDRQHQAQTREAEAQAGMQREAEKLQADLSRMAADQQIKEREAMVRLENLAANREQDAAQHLMTMEKGALEIELLRTKVGQAQIGVQADVMRAEQDAARFDAETQVGAQDEAAHVA